MEIYHILNRGVDKRDIVLDDSDRLRFVHSLFIFNDSRPLDENHRRRGAVFSAQDRKPLVHIHAWCLMNNHYHLLVSALNDDLSNLSSFMKKLNMGYARYFNERHDRSGYLWQGKYKKILLQKDAHFIYIPYYIHLNPLDYSVKEWRQGTVINTENIYSTLSSYRWSSFLDYNGKKNFPSVLYTNVLSAILGESCVQQKQIALISTSAEHSSSSTEIEK